LRLIEELAQFYDPAGEFERPLGEVALRQVVSAIHH
jgi:hypothetical protein